MKNYLKLVISSVLMFVMSASILQVLAQPVSSGHLHNTAPTFQILLDNSKSSPASDQQLIERAWPLIQRQLRSMPMATKVYVNTVGNAEVLPQSFQIRIQHRRTEEGAPMAEVVQKVKALVLGFPNKLKEGKIEGHNSSHLIGGLFDASLAINPKSERNVIIYVTDLIEFSSLANCYKFSPCRLPNPEFQLPNTELIVMGAGTGLASDKEMALVKSWREFFSKMHLSNPPKILTKSMAS